MENLINIGNSIEKELVNLRHELHMNPEPSKFEEKTAEILLNHLKKIEGIEINSGLGNGNHGIIVDLKGKFPGKKIALRADMDALLIKEETNCSFKSKNPDYMHACGHDTHMTMVFGALKILSLLKDNLKGSVRIIFQPAEELAPEGGAKSMIKAGALNDVDAIFGIHVIPNLPFGVAGTKSGPLLGASDHFSVKIQGKPSHGAAPDEGIDALLAGTMFVNNVQQIISRNLNPIDSPAILTIGKFQAGTRYNIVPGQCEMEGTVRTFTNETRTIVEKRLEEILNGVLISTNAQGSLNYEKGYMPLVNTHYEAEFVKNEIVKLFGKEKLFVADKPRMQGDDFAFYLNERKGAFIYIGTGDKKNGSQPLHSSQFLPDDKITKNGALLLASIVLNYK